jgi:hypothetical protein
MDLAGGMFSQAVKGPHAVFVSVLRQDMSSSLTGLFRDWL